MLCVFALILVRIMDHELHKYLWITNPLQSTRICQTFLLIVADCCLFITGDIFNHSTAIKRLSLNMNGSQNGRSRGNTNASLGMLLCAYVAYVICFCVDDCVLSVHFASITQQLHNKYALF